MKTYINISVDSGTIGKEMSNDAELTHEILSELVYQLEGDYTFFVRKLCDEIWMSDEDDVLLLLEAIVKEFAHLKETNND